MPYVDFYLSDEGQEFVSVAGYVRIAPDALEATRAAWESAKATPGGAEAGAPWGRRLTPGRM